MAPNNVKYPDGCQPISAGSTNAELLKRLKNLSEALEKSTTNEEIGRPNRYAELMEHLTEDHFLSIKNKDVQLLLACCIADLFRIFAPNSPIEEPTRLKNVLLFISAVIGNATDKENSMHRYYLYLLENITLVGTMQLALELGDDDAYVVLRQLIKQSLGSVNEKNADEHIQGMLLGICSKLIQGVDEISTIVLDAIFYFIVQPQKINNREAYRMARDLIRTNQTTLEPYVSMLLKRGLETGILDECDLISPKKLHDLVCELHKFAPELISTALPSLIDILRSEDVVARRETARLFGNLFGDQNSRLAEDEADVWNEYMKRFADVNEEIRRICIRDAEDILVFHPELRGQVTDAIILRCQDVDENVRLEVITMVQGLTKRKFEALSERLLTHVIDRIRDKKVRVRHAAIRGLSHLHRAVFSNDDLTNLERATVLGIFSSIMNHYYQPLPEDRLLTEKIFVSNLIPYKLEEDKRMGILLSIFLHLDGYGIKAFGQILTKQSFQRRQLHDLVKLMEQTAEPQKGRTVDDVMKRIVECNPEPAKFSLVFRQFMEQLKNDRQLLLLLKYISGKECTCQKVEAAILQILQRLRDRKVSQECMDAVRTLFECCAPLQFDGAAVSVLIDKAVTSIKRSPDDGKADRCHRLFKLLKIVAGAYPHCFVTAPTMESLKELIEMEGLPEIERLLSLVITISAELKEQELLAEDMIARYVKCCERISFEGTPRTAKYAVRCISSLLNAEEARIKLASIVQDSLPHISATDPQCCTAFKALSSCIEADAAEFCEELLEVLKTKVMDLLLDQNDDNEFSAAATSQLNDSDADSELSGVGTVCDEKYVAIKKHCLKFVAKFLISVAQFAECDVEPVAKNLFKLYSTLLKTKGDIFKKSCRQTDMAEFRVVAGSSMLKLAAKPRYAKFITADDLVTLSALGYDEVPEVRHRFFSKLNKHLMTLQLHVEYMGLFSLAALSEGVDFRNKIRVLVDANITRRRKYLERPEAKEVAPYYQPEYCLAYAIYVLSKLPSFESIKCEPELRRLMKCLWFLVEIFCSRKEPGSLEFICNIFKTVKNCTDSVMQGCTKEELLRKNEKIWALCDIGMLLMSYRVKGLMKDVECKTLLSKRFFLNMGRANIEVYVPESFIEEMRKGKVNAKHPQGDETEVTSKASSSSRQSSRRSTVRKPTASSKRKITEKPVRSRQITKALTNGASRMEVDDNSDKSDKVVTKRPKLAAEEQQTRQTMATRKSDRTKSVAVVVPKKSKANGDSAWGLEEEEAPAATSTPVKDKKVMEKQKRPAPLKNLNSDEPGTSKMSPNKSQNIRGSLENCDYSPIRPINERSPNLAKSIAVRSLPFTSSTPINRAKMQPKASKENGDGPHAVKQDVKVSPKKLKKEEPKSENRIQGDKVKKISATRKAKVSTGKVNTQKAETSSIASRLRSRRQVAASSSAQPVIVKPAKK